MKGKGNDGTGNIAERDSWETDQELFNFLKEKYNIEFDCCATKYNTKCKNFSNNFEETKEITFTAWMNPPFSIAREMFEHFFKVVKKGIAIYRCDNLETKIYQEVILKNADWIFIPKGRWSYTPFDVVIRTNGKKGCRFPSALIGIGINPPEELEGITLFVKNAKGVQDE